MTLVNWYDALAFAAGVSAIEEVLRVTQDQSEEDEAVPAAAGDAAVSRLQTRAEDALVRLAPEN